MATLLLTSMKKAYSFLLASTCSLMLFTSCSRSSYSFNKQVPAYLGTSKVLEPVLIIDAEQLTSETVAIPSPSIAKKTTEPATTQTILRVRPSVVQRVALKSALKKLTAKSTSHQNITATQHTASKAGKAALVLAIGAVIILIGGLIGGANIVVTIGGIAFIVGLIMLIIALING